MCAELPFLNPVSGFKWGKETEKDQLRTWVLGAKHSAKCTKHIILFNLHSNLVRSIFLFPLHRWRPWDSKSLKSLLAQSHWLLEAAESTWNPSLPARKADAVDYPVLPTAGQYPTSFLPVYHSPLPHHTQPSTSTREASKDSSGTEPKKYELFFKARSVSPISSCAQRKAPWTMISKGLTWTPQRKGSSLIHLLCGRTGKWRQGEPDRNTFSEFSVLWIWLETVWSEFPCCFCIPTAALTSILTSHQLCATRCRLMS